MPVIGMENTTMSSLSTSYSCYLIMVNYTLTNVSTGNHDRSWEPEEWQNKPCPQEAYSPEEKKTNFTASLHNLNDYTMN